MSDRVDFLVVGTPRSGTTLVQRLVCELPGVRMPPETHFFWFAAGLLDRHQLPLDTRTMREELSRFASLDTSRDLPLDVEAVMDRLAGFCDSVVDLFAAVVNQMAGPCSLVGEKTPEHLEWWRPLSRLSPLTRFVAVVRDPRAVVASNVTAPWAVWDRAMWGDDLHIPAAARWRRQQREVDAMHHALGPSRCLVVRYEELVSDPDGAKSTLERFLGAGEALREIGAAGLAGTEGNGATPAPSLVLPWESWKTDAKGPITDSRSRAWNEVLDARQVEQVTAICRPVMQRFGYEEGAPGVLRSSMLVCSMGPRIIRRLRGFRVMENRRLARVESVDLVARPTTRPSQKQQSSPRPRSTTAQRRAAPDARPDVPDYDRGGVVAVVLTHRRPRLATRVVRDLVDVEGFSPSQVLLVVNGEGGTTDADLEQSIGLLRLDVNLGPAGGFRNGLEKAFAYPAVKWAYLCEDDVTLFDLPLPRVERVLAEVARWEAAHPGEQVGAVVAYGRRNAHRQGCTDVFVPEQDEPALVPVDAAAWGATLVSRRVFEQGVLPDLQMFFGYEDFDFFYSLRRAGFALLVDTKSARATAAHMSLHGRASALGAARPVDAEEGWRAYYVARNFFVLARRHGNLRWLGWHVLYSLRRMQLAETRGERLATLRGLWDGARGRLGCNPRFVQETGEWAETVGR